jgi:hypothetical protein
VQQPIPLAHTDAPCPRKRRGIHAALNACLGLAPSWRSWPGPDRSSRPEERYRRHRVAASPINSWKYPPVQVSTTPVTVVPKLSARVRSSTPAPAGCRVPPAPDTRCVASGCTCGRTCCSIRAAPARTTPVNRGHAPRPGRNGNLGPRPVRTAACGLSVCVVQTRAPPWRVSTRPSFPGSARDRAGIGEEGQR